MIITSGFIIGSAIGAVATFIYKDEGAKDKALQIKKSVSDILFKKKEDSLADAIESEDGFAEAVTDEPLVGATKE
jgi:hypothetical protein